MKSSLRIALAAALMLAGCGALNTPSLPSQPTPGPTCQPPSGVQSALVYPAPNSTGVSDTFGQVIIGSTAALPSSWNVVVTTVISYNGVGGGTFQAATPPFPTPSATPSFANPVYQSSSFGSAPFSGEVVTVYLNDTATSCTPMGPVGKFTTQ